MASGPNSLEVTVHEARGIVRHDRGGASDAIVHVQVAGRMSTPICPKTTHPCVRARAGGATATHDAAGAGSGAARPSHSPARTGPRMWSSNWKTMTCALCHRRGWVVVVMLRANTSYRFHNAFLGRLELHPSDFMCVRLPDCPSACRASAHCRSAPAVKKWFAWSGKAGASE